MTKIDKLIKFLQKRALAHDTSFSKVFQSNEDRDILVWIDKNVHPFKHGEDVAKLK